MLHIAVGHFQSIKNKFNYNLTTHHKLATACRHIHAYQCYRQKHFQETRQHVNEPRSLFKTISYGLVYGQ